MSAAEPTMSHPREALEAVAALLGAAGAHSTAEMLKALRQAFPHLPLAERVAALAALRGS